MDLITCLNIVNGENTIETRMIKSNSTQQITQIHGNSQKTPYFGQKRIKYSVAESKANPNQEMNNDTLEASKTRNNLIAKFNNELFHTLNDQLNYEKIQESDEEDKYGEDSFYDIPEDFTENYPSISKPKDSFLKQVSKADPQTHRVKLKLNLNKKGGKKKKKDNLKYQIKKSSISKPKQMAS